ncbi:MAG: transcriptional regulator, TraR/DksA family protein [Nitrospiraceae bacterium]|jgi:DnaK suppressor protein|nr:transcriptional regulator, TraR/DksA family protein [Nitrospiraceae bacterium]
MPSKKIDDKKKTLPKGAAAAPAAKRSAVKPDPAKDSEPVEKQDERNERLRRQLVQKREEILRESKKEIKKQISGENRQFVETVLDDGDLAVVDVSEDINLKQLTAHRQMLLKIDAALTKLREGSYGICEECGCEIEEGRLKVLPFAICCRDCQETREEMDKLETQHE